MITLITKACKRKSLFNRLEKNRIKIINYFNTSSVYQDEQSSKNLGLPPSSFVTNRPMKGSSSVATIKNENIKKSVFISQSNDIFTNLALEDWLYRHFDFRTHHVLLLWVNDPCVVIGRHQNPFMEANVSELSSQGVIIARRNSGGGAVFHDRGNLNCTFFTPRERYNRKYNLNILTRAIFREWAIKSDINERDDICINQKKLSGTAAKLGYPNAYHHCTLLANTNKHNLGNCLRKGEVSYISNSTLSVRSPIKNLCEINRNVNISQLIAAVGYEYLRTFATELEDGGNQQIMKQLGFQLINPTEKWFPGIDNLRTEFSSWEWNYGRTPKFTVKKELILKDSDKEHKIILNIAVEKGIINGVTITMPNNERLPVVSSLQHKNYNESNLNKILNALKLACTDNIMQAINSH
ncbi:PREDICTED: lipoyltransferase 1, mitochondrial isoform X1 [Rhagoletis zephyria]|uniref:lipoyltransferase 1, mitochondrial isoform X1 n=1 Tax=Rhagoletis zephyria TaxID=28612 RepID=UPI00081149D0|nr:PREDICTED: lipoyltransferase 1, mitochondrial isoform X1 [Rhagoletis zephyria]